MAPSKKAILATLTYSDIFDYPLMIDEIVRYLIANRATKKEQVQQEITLLNRYIEQREGLYFLRGRSMLVKKRQLYEHYSAKKMQIAYKVAEIIAHIPTVMLVGLSGSLAMNNAAATDDIDLFIITKTHTMWITRLLIMCVLHMLDMRRKRKSVAIADSICVNMYMDETHLGLSTVNQNIYTAHEVVQMKPLVTKDRTYSKFLAANIWITNFLPNWNPPIVRIKKYSIITKILIYIMRPLEYVVKPVQLLYMRRHRTTEVITDSVIAFHPANPKCRILNTYTMRMRAYEI